MIGFTKEEIVAKANEWMDKNQTWADQVTNDAMAKEIDPFRSLGAGVLVNLRVILPKAISEIMEEQNKLMEKQIEEMIKLKIQNHNIELHK